MKEMSGVGVWIVKPARDTVQARSHDGQVDATSGQQEQIAWQRPVGAARRIGQRYQSAVNAAIAEEQEEGEKVCAAAVAAEQQSKRYSQPAEAPGQASTSTARRSHSELRLGSAQAGMD